MAEKKRPRYGAWIIVGVILLGLAGFGTGGLSGNIRSIGTVGDQDITVTAYQRALNQQIRALSAQFGQPISFQQAQAFGIDGLALGQVVLEATLDNEAAMLGLSVGDARVFERLQAIPDFQGASGFNRDTYRMALRQRGQSAPEFEDGLRAETARTLLQGAVVSGIAAPESYAAALVRYIAETRSVTWAVVDADMLIAPTPGATEADQEAYYAANPAAFTLPEARNITYAWLTPDMIMDDMVIAESAVAQLYEQRRAEFIQPERRLVERLVFLDPAQADAAAASLADGSASFDDLVAERGLTLADVDMGDVSADDLGDAGAAVFAADTGAVVGPLDAGLGSALFRVNAVLAAQNTPLAEAAPDLRDELAADAARSYIREAADGIIDLLAGGASMTDLAERTDMTLGQIAWSADLSEGIAAYDAFRREAAAVAEGDFASLQDLADGGIFALTLDSITPPSLQPIEAVREQLIAAVMAEKELDAIMALAQDIAENVLPLTDLATLGLAPQVETALTRRSFVPGTPPDFNDTLFGLAPGDVAVLQAEDRAIILRLDQIIPADLTDPDVIAQREALAGNAGAGIAQDVFEAYADRLRQDTPQRLDQNAITAVNAYFQ